MAKKLHNNKYDNAHFNKTELKVKQIGKLYKDLIHKVLSGFQNPKLESQKFFSFDDYSQYKERMQEIFEKFSLNITTEINKQSKEAWKYADVKNQKLLDELRKAKGISQKELRDKYSKANLEALRAFQNRKEKGLNLSDRVWNNTKNFKKELELAIDAGIRDGKSASELARDVQKYLLNPDKLFRKVKDHHGNLGLSKAAKTFHPGPGVYRSSVKNAMRLARTENNMAYHESNFEKYKQFDFVVGIRIKLSNNSSHCPFCEAMQGDYPKDFKFLGWHPHCRCTSVPILKSRSEMQKDNERLIQGLEPLRSQNEVLTTPQAYNDYVEKNRTKLESMSSKPYWFRDNSNLKSKEAYVPEKVKKVKTEEEKKLIQEKWDNRKKVYSDIEKEYQDLIKEIDFWNTGDDTVLAKYKKDLKEHHENYRLFKIRDLKGSIQETLEEIKGQNFDVWSYYLTNPYELINKFTPGDLDFVIKLNTETYKKWESESGKNKEYLIKKLKFEIPFVKNEKKYATWEVAESFYKKKLFDLKVEEVFLAKDKASEFLIKELKTNKTLKGQKFLDDLAELQKQSLKTFDLKPLESLLQEAETYIEDRKSKKLKGNPNQASKVLSSGAYSEERKKMAIKSDSPGFIDELLRDDLSKRWEKMPPEAKAAAFHYTDGSGKFNRPLRGFSESWFNFKGKGKVPFDNEEKTITTHLHTGVHKLDMKTAAKELAKEIEKHKLKKDMWIRRGDETAGFDGLFKTDLTSIRNDPNELKKLIGRRGVDDAFLSTSPSIGKGFKNIIDYEIYAPAGTEAIYAEPFSSYGHGGKSRWDGKSKQSTFSSEFELIINQGYEYEILDIEFDKVLHKVRVKMQILSRDKRFKYF